MTKLLDTRRFFGRMDHKDLKNVFAALARFGSLCFCQGKLFTVFSASNYCGLTGAAGSWWELVGAGRSCTRYSERPPRQPGSCVDLKERQPGHLEDTCWESGDQAEKEYVEYMAVH